jgi:chromosomal replication initiator protein
MQRQGRRELIVDNAKEIWARACELLAEKLPKDVFERWIEVIVPRQLENETLTLAVANDFYQTWLEDNYLPLISNALTATTGKQWTIHFAVDPSQRLPVAREEDHHDSEPARVAEAPRSAHIGNTLNPLYTFDNFVVGPSNNFAHAAARAVSESPARAYNPLFIYGGAGLGKTHLMQAIGHFVLQQKKSRVCYTTCEMFTNDYIDALQKQAMPNFRKKYRGIDVLLIDDIHFLAGKDRMQEEFFHTFNTLHDCHKQIVMTSDRPASEIQGIEQRLVSRFEWGLVTQLEPPDVETRIAILRKKQQRLGLTLPDSALLFIAENIRANIRRLEGALVRISSYLSLDPRPLSLDQLQRILRDLLDQEAVEEIRPEDVMRAVAEHFDVRLGDLTGKQRPQYIAYPRQVAMYLCRKMTRLSLPAIGTAFGRNHATVLHACRVVDEKLKADPTFEKTLAAIRERLTKKHAAS